jgi:hypothetical protein
MALSDELLRLSQRAKQAEDRVQAAQTQARDRLEKDVDHARHDTQTTAEKIRTSTAAAAGEAEAWGDDMKRSWNQHLASVREKMDARKARHDAKVTELRADDANDYALFAIDLAYSAIEEAEYATLDAVLARIDADEAAEAAKP